MNERLSRRAKLALQTARSNDKMHRPALLTHVNWQTSDEASGHLRFPKHVTGSSDRCLQHVSLSLKAVDVDRHPSRTPQGRLVKRAPDSSAPLQPLCVRDGVAVFSHSPHTDDTGRKTPDRLYCVDLTSGSQLGTVYVGGYNELSTLEVSDCCLSADGTNVAIVVNMTSNFGNNSRVIVYDATNWREVYVLTVNGGKRAVALDYDPRYEHSRLCVAYHTDADSCLSVVSYDLPRHRTERCETVTFTSDADDASHTLIYAKGGAFIVMQLISAMWRSRDSFCETLVLDGETLRVLCRCEPTVVCLCHSECLSAVRPTFSECGGYFAFHTRDESRRDRDAENIQVFRLPVTVRLGAQCRVAILKCMSDSNDVNTLPLPEKLKEYLQFSPDYM